MCLVLVGFVGGLIAVASNPSPYFAALGLVAAAGMGCGALAGQGGSFLSLVLFLIYLGGMLVVFAYSAALAAEQHPEAWGGQSVMSYVACYVVGLMVAASVYWGQWSDMSLFTAEEVTSYSVVRADMSGAAMLYCDGAGMLLISAWMLLVTLFVVLELVRDSGRGSLRAV